MAKIRIEEKGNLSRVLGNSLDITRVPGVEPAVDVIRVRRGSNIGLHLIEQNGLIDTIGSFALVARANDRFGVRDHIVGYLQRVSLEYVDWQEAPVMLNHSMVSTANREFLGNPAYTHYEVNFIPQETSVIYFAERNGCAFS